MTSFPARETSSRDSAVGHLVEGSERSEDPALVGLHDVSVLDHLVQDDVNSVQVEHDLTTSHRNKTRKQTEFSAEKLLKSNVDCRGRCSSA